MSTWIFFFLLFPSTILASNATTCSSCGAVADIAVDYVLGKFLKPLNEQTIPDSTVSVFRLTHGKLRGLQSIHRTCQIYLNKDRAKNDTAILKACVGGRNIIFSSVIKTPVPGFSLFPVVTIQKINFDANVKIRFVQGAVPQLKDFNVRDRRIRVSFKGSLGPFSAIITSLLNSHLSTLALNAAKSAIKDAIQGELNKHPL